MTDHDRRRRHLTRRGLMGVVATTALAGCNALDGVSGDDEPTVRAHELTDIGPHESPTAPVHPSVPVEVPSDVFTDGRTRITGFLAELPLPLGPDDIPNEYVRRELTHEAEHATDGLHDALTAPTQLVALHSLQHARESARYAAAGWAYADDGLTASEMAQERNRTTNEAMSTREDHEYVGSDPVTAAVVHAEIERLLADAIETHPPGREETDLLTVAEWGETVESAQASLDTARALTDALTESLPTAAGTVETTLTGAAETLLAAVRQRRSDLSPEQTADTRDIGRLVLDDLRRQADHRLTELDDADGPASAVVDANRQLAAIGAYQRVRDRYEAGDITRPETADAVRERRQRAYDALRAALRESSTPAMMRTVLVGPAHRVVTADEQLAAQEGELPVSRLDHQLADYELATAVAEAAGPAAERTASALR